MDLKFERAEVEQESNPEEQYIEIKRTFRLKLLKNRNKLNLRLLPGYRKVDPIRTTLIITRDPAILWSRSPPHNPQGDGSLSLSLLSLISVPVHHLSTSNMRFGFRGTVITVQIPWIRIFREFQPFNSGSPASFIQGTHKSYVAQGAWWGPTFGRFVGMTSSRT